YLTGMRAPRQTVYHRHASVAGKLNERVVIEGTDYDGVDVAREHARGVTNGLAATKLHFLSGEHDCSAAELPHGDVEGHTRSGRGPVEDHGKRPAHKRLRSTIPARLHGSPGSNHAAQLLRGDVDQFKEMTNAHPVAPWRASS